MGQKQGYSKHHEYQHAGIELPGSQVPHEWLHRPRRKPAPTVGGITGEEYWAWGICLFCFNQLTPPPVVSQETLCYPSGPDLLDTPRKNMQGRSRFMAGGFPQHPLECVPSFGWSLVPSSIGVFKNILPRVYCCPQEAHADRSWFGHYREWIRWLCHCKPHCEQLRKSPTKHWPVARRTYRLAWVRGTAPSLTVGGPVQTSWS